MALDMDDEDDDEDDDDDERREGTSEIRDESFQVREDTMEEDLELMDNQDDIMIDNNDIMVEKEGADQSIRYYFTFIPLIVDMIVVPMFYHIPFRLDNGDQSERWINESMQPPEEPRRKEGRNQEVSMIFIPNYRLTRSNHNITK